MTQIVLGGGSTLLIKVKMPHMAKFRNHDFRYLKTLAFDTFLKK